MKNNFPNIFEYLDIHIYLKDCYTHRKSNERSFSYESWSKELGIKSRSYLRLLIIGKRSITESVVPLFIENLKLNSDEVKYMGLLIQFSSATNHQLKQSYGQQLASFWSKSLNTVTIENLTQFLQDPLIPVLFTYFSYSASNQEVSHIARTFGVENQRIHNCIKVLLKENMIELMCEPSGEYKFKTITAFFKVPDNPGNELLKKFHLEGIDQAKESQHLPFEQRRFRSLLFAMSPEQIGAAQQLINEFAQQVLKSFETENVLNKRIYRMNLQLFPISDPLEFQDEKIHSSTHSF